MKGHARKRGNNTWELRAYVGLDPITNRHKYVTRTFHGGKREADEALARFVTEVGGGGHSAHDATLGDLIYRWLDLVRNDLSPSTLRSYEFYIRIHIMPTFSKAPLARLKTSQLDRFYAKLRESGGPDGGPLAPATVRKVHAIIRRALQQGVRWGWISSNPASLATPPRVRVPQLSPPSVEDVIAIIERAGEANPDLGCFLLLAATTGARRGELCALRWSDVDLPGSTLTISHSIVEAGHGQLLEKDTKTHSSRHIALDQATHKALLEHQKRCEERALACGNELRGDAYVFSLDPDGMRPWVPSEVTKKFIRIRKAMGLDGVRLHDLRHFAATRLLAEGVPVRTVSGRLGHANAATTLGVYAHFLEESDREAAAKLGALLDRGRAAWAAKQQ
jgi:integrase